MELSPQFSAELDNTSRVARVLWIGLMASVGMHGLAMYLVSISKNPPPEPMALHPAIFPALGLGFALLGSILYTTFTSRDRLQALVSITRTAKEEYDALPQKTEKAWVQLQALSPAELRLSRVLALGLTMSIWRWAAFEGIAILGVVLAINHHSFIAFAPYGFASLVLQACTPPAGRGLVLAAIPLLPIEHAEPAAGVD